MDYKFETRCIHGNGGLVEGHPYGAVSVPIFQTATFAHPGIGRSTGYDYTRESNPTRHELESVMSTLEEADERLESCVRDNDIRGVSKEGELYLILVQADHNFLPFIQKRLERARFSCRSIDEPINIANQENGESK